MLSVLITAIESVRDDEEYSDSSDDENLPVPQDYLCDLESMPESVQRAFVQLHSDEGILLLCKI